MRETAARVAACLALLTLPAAAQTVGSADDRCAWLRGLAVPAEAIGLPTGGADIILADLSGTAPQQVCTVIGTIDPVDPEAPDIVLQVNMPLQWNGKALHYGGGGYNGRLVTGREPVRFNPDGSDPVARGYATFGSDSGHQSPSSLDGTFMLNDEALKNFGGDQLKKTHDVALAVMGQFYGHGPERTYVQGASQGGHEAMIAIERWPDDYDGAIVVHPANPFVGLQLSGNRAAQALYRGNAWLAPADVGLLDRAVMAECDALDGAADGMVSDTRACDATFDVGRLRCEDGLPQRGTCFGDAQLEALATLASRTRTPPLKGGLISFAAWPIFLGADLTGIWGLGSTSIPTVPPTPMDNFGLAVLADPTIRFGILRDPTADSLNFEPMGQAPRIAALSAITDAVSSDLRRFADHGGKILLLHGITDFAIPYGNTVDWYERVVADMGPDATRDMMRFYLVPGFGHGSGVFQLRWDSLAALEAWAERGVAPAGLVATDAAPATAGRTRPLCEYPAYPRRADPASDIDAAASYACVTP